MALTPEERAELRTLERRAQDLRAKKNAEASEKRRQDAMARRKAHRNTPGQREQREQEPAFLAYLRRQPCAVAMLGGSGCEGPVQAAHIRFSAHGKGRNPGMGRKNHDRHANPLCARHHLGDQHQRKEQAFWADAGADAYDLAAAFHADFLAGGDGSSVARRFGVRERRQA